MYLKARKALFVLLILSLALPMTALAQAETTSRVERALAPQDTATVTLLHTNDFHGNLQASGSNPGAARVAQYITNIRTAVGAENVLLLDAGDMMQGTLLSNLQKGEPTMEYYANIGYDAVTFGNHEFDWGQDTLKQRVDQAAGSFPFLAANIVKQDSFGGCTGWEKADFVSEPYHVFTTGSGANELKVGVIGVSSIETPFITVESATAGLCFKDPAEAIGHYYSELDAQAEVLVVLSHNGLDDGGYGYGFTVYGDKTLAKKLNTSGTPVDLIIGGHSHTNMAAEATEGSTKIVQAYYAGRQLGQATITYDKAAGKVAGITWTKNVVATTDPENPEVKAWLDAKVSDPAYQAKINEEIGWTQVDLVRNYNGDSLMGAFVNDAIYNYFKADSDPANDVDIVFNNSGGLRADQCAVVTCTTGLLGAPFLLTYGRMFEILPFGNQTITGDMSGAQIQELLNQSATLFKGAIQVSGIQYKFFAYTDTLPGPQPYAWGAFDVQVRNRESGVYEPLDLTKTYRIATNEFLAPAGQDGFSAFKYVTNIAYYGDMLDTVNNYVKATFPAGSPYLGPDGAGGKDGRIMRDGDSTGGSIIPLTVLHHNDSHGRLLPSGSAVGMTQLATLIAQQRAHNPTRTLLLSAGDNLQGDSMMYYFKSAGLGYAADGTTLPAELQINPMIKVMNALGYDGMTLGNHEFNFGSEVFGTLEDATFPILQANVVDNGSYGLADVQVKPYVLKTVGAEGIKVAILGIGNHRIPSYELPSNIPGLTFINPIDKGKELAPLLQASNDVVIALTHIGFTGVANSVEVDSNVDTVFAAEVPGVNLVVGGHSHTDPNMKTAFSGDYSYLPAVIAGPNGVPVLVGQAYRYNTYLGQMVVGLRSTGSGLEIVSQAGRAVKVDSATVEDAAIKDLVTPYNELLAGYNNIEIGQTLTEIDTNDAFTQETNGANLQADAAVWKLRKEGALVDFHLSGAMTNKLIASGATPENPFTLKVSHMFEAMPYENSLVVMRMNGPQLKAVLERAYRNYFFYKHVPGWGGYSHYTTCMLDTNAGAHIAYLDTYPAMPDGHNVRSLTFDGKRVNFNDADTYYNVSSVNYLAAGACNFSDNNVSLWPLNQIVLDTQYYVRDSVTEYIQAQTTTINPVVEGRLMFNALFLPTLGR